MKHHYLPVTKPNASLAKRPLPEAKNKKVTGLMNEREGNIITKLATTLPKT